MTPPDAWDLPTVDALLTRTRSVRLGLDLEAPVERDLLIECLRIALQAPNGGNQQYWRWILVIDAEQRRRIGAIYRTANPEYEAYLRGLVESGDEAAARALRSSSVLWEHLGEVPALLFACFEKPAWFDGSSYSLASVYGSVFPAVWSFQLAARSRGLGTCIVTAHLRREAEINAVLGIPETFGHAAMVAIGKLRTTTAGSARRQPLDEVMRVDRWE